MAKVVKDLGESASSHDVRFNLQSFVIAAIKEMAHHVDVRVNNAVEFSSDDDEFEEVRQLAMCIPMTNEHHMFCRHDRISDVT